MIHGETDSKQLAESIAECGFQSGYTDKDLDILKYATKCGVEAGLKTAMCYITEQKKQQKNGRYDRRLRNTGLLLENYRSLKNHAKGAVYNAIKAKENAIDILDELENKMLDDNLYIEGIKQSQQRTLIILNHIDEMLKYYRIACEENGREEEKRRYRIIMAAYIDNPRRSVDDIIKAEYIERRTYYRDIKEAKKPLSALFFGIDGINTNN